MTPVLRAALGYGYLRVPFTARAAAGRVVLAHRVRRAARRGPAPHHRKRGRSAIPPTTSPNAGPGGTRFSGFDRIGPSREELHAVDQPQPWSATRATNVSGFEENAFFVTNAIEFLLRAGLPWSLALQAGAGYHRNDYRTVASEIGAPRRDEIRGWTLGLGRPVTRYAFVRADYRRERRDSNIDSFDSPSNALIVEIGLGLFAAQPR